MHQYSKLRQTMSPPNEQMPSNGGGGGSDRDGLIQVNDLVYKLEPDMSVATQRTHKNHFFQSPTYTNQQPAISILNSGADYIDTRRSFLHLEVELSSIVCSGGGPRCQKR